MCNFLELYQNTKKYLNHNSVKKKVPRRPHAVFLALLCNFSRSPKCCCAYCGVNNLCLLKIIPLYRTRSRGEYWIFSSLTNLNK